MSMHAESILKRIQQGQLTRVLAFGSSNTERRSSGMHWFDCFELAVAQTIGRAVRCINTGVGGHTSRDLLDRFEADAAFYRPHLAFITIGGNDANPEKRMDAAEFEGNLLELHRRFQALECAVVFQTYYAPNPALINAPHLTAFYQRMETVRQVAARCNADLIDHLRRWEPFRQSHPARYTELMLDGFHVNRLGNMVMGLDIARHVHARLGDDAPDYWQAPRAVQALMDAL
jgi:lysophospholipase L1-like esterase